MSSSVRPASLAVRRKSAIARGISRMIAGNAIQQHLLLPPYLDQLGESSLIQRLPVTCTAIIVRSTASGLTWYYSISLHCLTAIFISDQFWLASRPGSQAVIMRNRLIRLDEVAIERLNRTLRNLAKAEIVARTTIAEARRRSSHFLMNLWPGRRHERRSPVSLPL